MVGAEPMLSILKKSHVIRLREACQIPYQAYTYATDMRSAEDMV
jgi:hypothetical protein